MFSAAQVGDALDRLLVLDSSIVPICTQSRIVGTALPVLTRAGDNLAIHRALDDARPGDVLVVNGQADTSRALLGEILGELMAAKGLAGAIVDGAVRDGHALDALNLAIFARCLTPAGPFKNGPGLVGDPVAVGSVVVGPGDIIVTDADGVAIVPLAEIDRARARLVEIARFEESLRDKIHSASGHD